MDTIVTFVQSKIVHDYNNYRDDYCYIIHRVNSENKSSDFHDSIGL